jgi:hypothetical protein
MEAKLRQMEQSKIPSSSSILSPSVHPSLPAKPTSCLSSKHHGAEKHNKQPHIFTSDQGFGSTKGKRINKSPSELPICQTPSSTQPQSNIPWFEGRDESSTVTGVKIGLNK